jgi:glycosyltransferase involved in cell wall biosynthesis
MKRVLARLKILQKTIQVKPDVLIVNTHELLIVALLNRIIFGTKIVYDIQENYWRNILWTDAFPRLLRPFLATVVRLKEWCFARFFHLFFLAEKGYEKELGFIKKNYVVLENKSQLPATFLRQANDRKRELIFTGTLSKSTGVFEAIHLADLLHTIDPDLHLTLIGFCARASELSDIKKEIQEKSYITLVGGDKLVPHREIISRISTANFGIISYPITPHLENKIPTKLYEYLHARLPILLRNHAPWVALCQPDDAAIPVNFEIVNPEELIQKMKSTRFYISEPRNVDWALEEKKLMKSISEILT